MKCEAFCTRELRTNVWFGVEVSQSSGLLGVRGACWGKLCKVFQWTVALSLSLSRFVSIITRTETRKATNNSV